jgi:Tfp pilus assembly protein PilV
MTAPRNDDRGETLVEIVISVLLIGIAVTALVAASTSSVNLSLGHRRLTDTDVALKKAAEGLKAATYKPAATKTSYSVAADPGIPVNVAVTSVLCLPGTTGATVSTSTAKACTSDTTELQLVVLTATGSGTSETTTILKRYAP